MNHAQVGRSRHRRVRLGVMGGIVALIWSVLAAVTTTVPASAASTLNLNVGGLNANGISANDFYPGLVTIQTGDSISWHFKSFHTVNFYTAPGNPEADGVGNG